ncbi:hypothetical protein ACFE04_011929 [Oxalis oulophora]
MSYENYDILFPDQPVVDLYLPMWANLPAFRSKPAFIWAEDGSCNSNDNSTLTYAELNHSVQVISSQLSLQLERRGTAVILCSPGLELVEIIFGCQRAGLLTVPISPPDPSFENENYHHLVRVLSQTKPKAAIAHRDYIASVQRYISSSSSNQELAKMLKGLKWISTQEIKTNMSDLCMTAISSSSYTGCATNEVYLIQYTSGATGIPKPVLVTAGSAAHNVRMARKAYDLHPNTVIISWLPQYHDCGLMFLLLTIVSGASCVLASPMAFLNRPRLWLELITKYKGTCSPVPSLALPLVVKRGGINRGNKPINLSSLKNLIIVNEPIYKTVIEEFVHVFKAAGLNPCSISPSYGLAENCTFVTTAWSKISAAANFPTHKKLLPSARLASEDEDTDIVIVNESTHEPTEDGIEGEVWVSSPSNCSGYHGHPNLSREIFKARIRNKISQTFVRTGDRGIVIRTEDARYLFVTGRCSDVINLPNGQEIHPHFIETLAFNSFPTFIRAGCVAAFNITNTVAVVAEMQGNENDKIVLRRICEGIRKCVMEEEKVEVGVVFLVTSGDVPKTTSGKIQRWLAKDKLIEGKMNVVIEMRLDENVIFFPSQGWIGHLNKGKDVQQVSVKLSSNIARPYLQSLL